MCVGIGHPTMRFFAKRNSGLLSTMTVEVVFEGLGGALKSLPIGVVLGGTKWQPTLPYPVLASLLPLLPGQMTPVQFRFTPLLRQLADRRRVRRSLAVPLAAPLRRRGPAA